MLKLCFLLQKSKNFSAIKEERKIKIYFISTTTTINNNNTQQRMSSRGTARSRDSSRSSQREATYPTRQFYARGQGQRPAYSGPSRGRQRRPTQGPIEQGPSQYGRPIYPVTGQQASSSSNVAEEISSPPAKRVKETKISKSLNKFGLSLNDPQWNEVAGVDNELSVECGDVANERRTGYSRAPPQGMTVPEGYVLKPLKTVSDTEFAMVTTETEAERYGKEGECKYWHNPDLLYSKVKEPMASDSIAGQPHKAFEVDTGRTSENLLLPEAARQFEKPQAEEPSRADRVFYERSREMNEHILEKGFNFIKQNPTADKVPSGVTDNFQLNPVHPNTQQYETPEFPTPYGVCNTGTRNLMSKSHIWMDGRLNTVKPLGVPSYTVNGRKPDSYMEKATNGYYTEPSKVAREKGAEDSLKDLGFDALPLSQYGQLDTDAIQRQTRKVATNEYSLDGHAPQPG